MNEKVFVKSNGKCPEYHTTIKKMPLYDTTKQIGVCSCTEWEYNVIHDKFVK